jgi:hypothetical protein
MPTIADLGKVQRVQLASLTPYPANARLITAKAVQQTAASLQRFGWQQPMVADPGRVLVVGHVRHAAALSLGATTGPAVITDKLTADEVKAYRIADNRTHDYTAWDYGKLAAELGGLPPDLAGVLDLADWQQIVDRFAADGEQARDLLTGHTDAQALVSQRHQVTVVFATQEAADLAGPAILKLPGVLDVRYPR